jgi:predicted nucleic acid-binding protein
VRLVIAGTGPINYLVLIGHIGLLPCMFDRIAVPRAVQAELSNPLAPSAVRRWIGNWPGWLEIHDTVGLPQVPGLDDGETAAIALAESLQASLLLLDERDGVRAARKRGLHVVGTLGLLDLAADRGLINFVQAASALERTNFRIPRAVPDLLLATHNKAGKP